MELLCVLLRDRLIHPDSPEHTFIKLDLYGINTSLMFKGTNISTSSLSLIGCKIAWQSSFTFLKLIDSFDAAVFSYL